MTVHDLRGDSTISSLQFLDGHVSFLWDNENDGTTFLVRLETDTLISNLNSHLYCVHPRLISLAEFLWVDPVSKRYIAPTDGLIGTMQIVREGLHLALGRHSEEFKSLLQIRNSMLVLACPIRDEASIEVTRLPDEKEP
jgi:hypothetical protein